MTLALAEAGASVIATASRELGEIEAVAATAGETHILPLLADVTCPDDCARVVQTAVERLGRLDLLVNNTGTRHEIRQRVLT